jgi:predicted PurR-regulated permease PerM
MESMTMQWLHIIYLTLTPIKRWEAAKRPFMSTTSPAETWLTVFGIVVLIVSVILLFVVRAKHKQIARLTATKQKLLQQITGLQQQIAELNRDIIQVIENIIDAKPPAKQTPGFNPQEIKALSELAKHLQ